MAGGLLFSSWNIASQTDFDSLNTVCCCETPCETKTSYNLKHLITKVFLLHLLHSRSPRFPTAPPCRLLQNLMPPSMAGSSGGEEPRGFKLSSAKEAGQPLEATLGQAQTSHEGASTSCYRECFFPKIQGLPDWFVGSFQG